MVDNSSDHDKTKTTSRVVDKYINHDVTPTNVDDVFGNALNRPHHRHPTRNRHTNNFMTGQENVLGAINSEMLLPSRPERVANRQPFSSLTNNNITRKIHTDYQTVMARLSEATTMNVDVRNRSIFSKEAVLATSRVEKVHDNNPLPPWFINALVD